MVKDVGAVFLFDNGMVATCNIEGEQIPELQGSYSIELHKKIFLRATTNCEWKGFEIIPVGWIESINNWYKFFKDA